MIRLLLLGSVDLTGVHVGNADAALRRSKRIALLAYLAAARPRGFHRRDKIAALFWPEATAERARGALRTALARLREDHGVDLVVRRGTDELAIDATLLQCDVLEFDAALDAGRFSEAVALYRGPFLDGFHVAGAAEELETWISAERTRTRDAVLRALATMADVAERAGDLAAASNAAQHALLIAPSDEILARRLIALSIASGNTGAAMATYVALEQRLQSEFGVAPSAATTALVARLRDASGPSAPPRSQRVVAQPVVDRVTSPAAATPPRRSSRKLVGAVAAALVLVVSAWTTSRTLAARRAPAQLMWRAITPIGDAPRGAFGSRAVLDSTDAFLVFGGALYMEKQTLVPLGAEYWRLRGLGAGDAPSWIRIVPAAGPHPAARWLSGISADAPRDRVILHGGALGFTSPCASDTWILDGASAVGRAPVWRAVRTRGATVPARADFDQVYDARRRRLIVFGGHDCIYPKFEDTWVLSFDDSTLATGEWRLLAPDSSAGLPRHRDLYTAAYDTANARMYIFGGRASTTPTSELWSLDRATGEGGTPAWRPIHCAGEAPALMHAASVMNFGEDAWYVFGGVDAQRQANHSVWRVRGLLRDLPHCRFEELPSTDPSPASRSSASAAALRRSRGVAIFGGSFGNAALSDAWVLQQVEAGKR